MTTYGYIRVSSAEQNEARQIETMKRQGVDPANVYVDKLSGKDLERPAYKEIKLAVKPGDTVIFDSITRMSRTKTDIQNEYKWFTDRNISLKFINEPMINYDADKAENDPVMESIPEIILTLLSAFAEKEREDIRKRQAEGIEAAKQRGQHLGRPKKSFETLSDEDKRLFKEQYRRWKNGDQTAVQTMKNTDLKKSTFYKIVKEYESLKAES